MRRLLKVGSLLILVGAASLGAQSAQQARDYNALLAQYQAQRGRMSATERREMDALFADLGASLGRQKVGSLTANPYLPGATPAPLSRYSPNSPSNPYSQYGSPYSPDGARNKYTTGGLDVIGADGEYLGKLNANKYDPNSVANPYGAYGSQYSPTSIKNPYGKYGSPYSPYSATNPYATTPPGLYTPKPAYGTLPLRTPSPSYLKPLDYDRPPIP
jgi:hypothetical protein